MQTTHVGAGATALEGLLTEEEVTIQNGRTVRLTKGRPVTWELKTWSGSRMV